MNPAKLIILFIILTFLLKFPTLAFKNSHKIFPTVDLKKLLNHPIHCSCHKQELLTEMVAVKFKKGNKYLISTEPIGEGGTALVFHAIYIGQKWEMVPKAKTNCVAIKVAKPPMKINNSLIANELAILNDMFKLQGKKLKLPLPSHNLRFLRSEIFEVSLSNKTKEYFAIVMELDYIFIDLKPQNVMVMPNLPNPKELYENNFGRLRIKLTDFGASQKFESEIGKRTLSENDKKHLMCSVFYRAPELYDTTIDKISPKTDIFSLGRLMLILAVQTPQMKIFTPLIKNFWKEWNEDGNCEESHINWVKFVGNMLLVANISSKIPSKMSSSPSSVRFGLDYDYDESEEESQSLKPELRILKTRAMVESENVKSLKMLYDELKRNYGHLMEIIERTQVIEQKQRPSALEIVAECSPKLAHLERNSVKNKSSHKSSNKSDSLIIRRTAAVDIACGSRYFKKKFRKCQKINDGLGKF